MTTTAGRHRDQDVKQHLPKTTRSGREAIPSEDASVRTTRVLAHLFTLPQRFKIKCFFVVQTMKEKQSRHCINHPYPKYHTRPQEYANEYNGRFMLKNTMDVAQNSE
jgi:hypothetical protein